MSENGIYEALAAVYDILNTEVSYPAWADFIERIFERYEAKKTLSIVDLGCGTGSMTLELARRGYDMIGIDNSPDMLAEARLRDDTDSRILWLEQELTDFELYGTVDAAVSCLDCVNHITDRKSVARFFRWVHNYLEPDGLFLFDVNSPRKFREVYGNNSYILEDKGVYCGWQNEYSEASGLCTFQISVFTENGDGTYTRTDGIERERRYTERQLDRLLAETGFEKVGVFGDYAFGEVGETTDRLYYVARAKKCAADGDIEG